MRFIPVCQCGSNHHINACPKLWESFNQWFYDGYTNQQGTVTHAIWNNEETAVMSEEQNLRNFCHQLEQKYVDWGHQATSKGCRVRHELQAIGELGRYLVDGVLVAFVTTRKREVEVQDACGKVIGKVKMQAGMAAKLYALVGGCI
jgi:hypothetical protein